MSHKNINNGKKTLIANRKVAVSSMQESRGRGPLLRGNRHKRRMGTRRGHEERAVWVQEGRARGDCLEEPTSRTTCERQ